jgi:hypothetical protein
MNNEIMEDLVIEATQNFTRILATSEIREKYPSLYWGGNGIGDRWANKKFNYTVIYTKKTRLYSENSEDLIPTDLLNEFLDIKRGAGIIGVFVHSKRLNSQKRPINKHIHKEITRLSCVVCGTNDTICDHKNDLYNDERVLNVKTQIIQDFQPLCNHCNLQKRQICRSEEESGILYSAKNIQRYKIYDFDFPWEKKNYDNLDIHCKTDTFWYDPVKFDTNIYCYSRYVIPIITEIKYKIKKKLIQVL